MIAGKYVIERVLGQGGMGVVVSASHATLNQRVALKFLLPEACEHEGAVQRFLREARAAVQIQSEHVARVTDVGTLATGAPYMVMEFLEGHDLAREIELQSSLPPQEIAEYLLQACEAIAEAHALTIVHRDLKPANLFLSRRKDGSRSIKVLDFGISKAVQDADANLTQTASMMGSPLYMAPEQIRNAKAVDARADIWSLGVILHEALSGSVPFGGETLSGVLAAIVADPPQSLSSLRPDLPEELTQIVARCLEKDPRRRIQDVVELAEQLALFAPVQAERTLPRVRALLGRTAPAGEIQGANGELAATVAGTTADESRTAQPWVRSESRSRAGRNAALPIALVVGGVLALGSGGALLWALSGPRAEGMLAESAQDDAELDGAAAAQTTAPPVESSSPLAPAEAPEIPEPAVEGPAAEGPADTPTKQDAEPAATAPPPGAGATVGNSPAVFRPASAQKVPAPGAPKSAAPTPPTTKAPTQTPEDPLDGRR